MLEINIKKKLNSHTLDINCRLGGRRIGILGASGAGKSMILKMIAGIERPDSGVIRLDERAVFDSDRNINIVPQKRHVGYCFQNYALFPHLSVYENIAVGLGRAERESVNRYLEKFELSEIRNSLPAKISGGQASRVAMARMLIRKPQVLLFDEAFSALDIYLKDYIQEEMSEWLRDFEGLVVFVSHSRDEIYRFCDTTVVIDSGRVSAAGSTEELFKNPVSKAAAILTGCKNISDIRYISDNIIDATEWGVRFELLHGLPENKSAIGIRAHDLRPIWGTQVKNSFEFRLKNAARLPFEDNYYISTDGCGDITWLVQRDVKEMIQARGLPDCLAVSEEDILWLK